MAQLLISITKPPLKWTHSLLDSHRPVKLPVKHHRLQRHLRRIRRIVQADGAIDGQPARFLILLLPQGPHTVDIGMVQEERRVSYRAIKIIHGRSKACVSTTMWPSQVSLLKPAGHDSLELDDIGRCEQGSNGIRTVAVGRDARIEVTLQTVRIVVEGIIREDAKGDIVEGAHVHRVVFERPMHHTATAGSLGKHFLPRNIFIVLSVAGERGVASVEVWASCEILCVR